VPALDPVMPCFGISKCGLNGSRPFGLARRLLRDDSGRFVTRAGRRLGGVRRKQSLFVVAMGEAEPDERRLTRNRR